MKRVTEIFLLCLLKLYHGGFYSIYSLIILIKSYLQLTEDMCSFSCNNGYSFNSITFDKPYSKYFVLKTFRQ